MTSKERVLQVWPDAMAWHPWFDPSRFVIVIPPKNAEFDITWGKKLSGVFDTKAKAWDDAASRFAASKLPAASPEPEQSQLIFCQKCNRNRETFNAYDNVYCQVCQNFLCKQSELKVASPEPEQKCPQCGNSKDNPREDSIERLLVCGDSFHLVASPEETTKEPMTTPIYSEQERAAAVHEVEVAVPNYIYGTAIPYKHVAIDLQCALTRTQAALTDSENLLRRIGLSSDQPEIRKAIDDFLARAR